MHKPFPFILVLVLAATSAWTSAAAQVTPMPSPSGSGSPMPSTAPAAGRAMTPSSVSQPGQPNFGQLMSSLNRMKSEVSQVQSLHSLNTNDVHIVKVQSMAGTDTAALNSALSRNASQVAALRNALGRLQLRASTDSHPLTFAQFLADNKLSLNQVVAADVSNGSLTAFIQ